MAYQCPHCERRILSRRSGLCAHCQSPLPAEMLLTAAELEAVEAEERGRERRRQERAEAKRVEFEAFMNSLGG
jgi:hypothetical protein